MWRFIHLSDPHLGSQSDEHWHNVGICSMMPDVIGCLRKDLSDDKPEFALVTGDICCRPTRDGVFAARDLLDSLGFPYYPVGGEDDFAKAESRDWFLDAFGARLPQKQTFSSFTHKHLHVIVLDTWWVWPDGSLCPLEPPTGKKDAWVIPPDRLTWLDADLTEHASLPTVIALHMPIVPIPKGDASGSHISYIQNADLVLALLARHPQVKAVLSGHAHVNCKIEQDGIVHVTTSALAEYPVEYREVRVYKDHIEFAATPLSELEYAAASLVEGNEWVAGQPEDRHFEITL